MSKKLAKNRLKSHIEYIYPNSMYNFQFGSVAQSVARLLHNRKVPGSNPAEGKVLFSHKYLELGLIGILLEQKLPISAARWRSCSGGKIQM